DPSPARRAAARARDRAPAHHARPWHRGAHRRPRARDVRRRHRGKRNDPGAVRKALPPLHAGAALVPASLRHHRGRHAPRHHPRGRPESDRRHRRLRLPFALQLRACRVCGGNSNPLAIRDASIRLRRGIRGHVRARGGHRMSALIEVLGLSKTFSVSRGMFAKRATLNAVSGVDLDVYKGEVLGIVGESGCGKSTLARMLLGLLPPSAGTIRLSGIDIWSIPRREIARRMQPVFQDPYSSLHPRRRIASVVALPLEVQGIGTPEERRAKAIAALEKVGLPARYADNYPNQLSGGQRQRVAIARALITE